MSHLLPEFPARRRRRRIPGCYEQYSDRFLSPLAPPPQSAASWTARTSGDPPETGDRDDVRHADNKLTTPPPQFQCRCCTWTEMWGSSPGRITSRPSFLHSTRAMGNAKTSQRNTRLLPVPFTWLCGGTLITGTDTDTGPSVRSVSSQTSWLISEHHRYKGNFREMKRELLFMVLPVLRLAPNSVGLLCTCWYLCAGTIWVLVLLKDPFDDSKVPGCYKRG